MLPRENDKIVELDCELVTAAIRRVALLADERSYALRLRLEQGRLELSSGGEYGDAHEVVDIAYGGTTLSIGFKCAVKRRWSTAGASPARELVRSAR